MWVTDENNRRIIGMLGRIIGEIFKNCRIEYEKYVRLRPSGGASEEAKDIAVRGELVYITL